MSVMTTLLGRRHLRLAVLLVVAAALAFALATGAGSTNSESDSGPSSPQLTGIQKTAAMNALERIAPPAGFHRYEHWRVGAAPRTPAVACLPKPAICFGSSTPLPTLTNDTGRALLAKFGVQAKALDCSPDGIAAPATTCPGYGTFSRYGLGVILTVVHAGATKLRSGTQVVLFAVKAK